MNLLTVLKNEIKTINSIVSVIACIIIEVIAISEKLDGIVSPPFRLLFNLSLAYIGILIPATRLLFSAYNKFSKNVPKPGQVADKEYRYTKRLRISATAIFLLYLLVGGVLASRISNLKNKLDNDCTKRKEFIGLLINNFSETQDEFASDLTGQLHDHIDNTKHLIWETHKYYSYNNLKSDDSLNFAFSNNCFKQGIFICGKHCDNTSFNCYIRIFKLSNFEDTIMKFDTSAIHIANEKFISLKSIVQAEMVTAFITSLLSYQDKDYDKTMVQLDSFINKPEYRSNKKLMAYCFLLKGNCFANKQDWVNAFKNYKEGLLYDSTDYCLKNNKQELEKYLELTITEDSLKSPLVKRDSFSNSQFYNKGKMNSEPQATYDKSRSTIPDADPFLNVAFDSCKITKLGNGHYNFKYIRKFKGKNQTETIFEKELEAIYSFKDIYEHDLYVNGNLIPCYLCKELRPAVYAGKKTNTRWTLYFIKNYNVVTEHTAIGINKAYPDENVVIDRFINH